MICLPCQGAADAEDGLVHDPGVCEDAGIQPHGCTCQHGSLIAMRIYAQLSGAIL